MKRERKKYIHEISPTDKQIVWKICNVRFEKEEAAATAAKTCAHTHTLILFCSVHICQMFLLPETCLPIKNWHIHINCKICTAKLQFHICEVRIDICTKGAKCVEHSIAGLFKIVRAAKGVCSQIQTSIILANSRISLPSSLSSSIALCNHKIWWSSCDERKMNIWPYWRCKMTKKNFNQVQFTGSVMWSAGRPLGDTI